MILCQSAASIVVLLLIASESVAAFQNSGARQTHPQTSPAAESRQSTTCLSADNSNFNLRPGSLEAATAELGRVPYGESSRKYRRTVYTHDDWLVHRNNDKLFGNLVGMFYSGVVRQVKNKILLVSSVAAFCILWNDFLYGYVAGIDNTIDLPHLTLPVMPFSLSSPALGLLLVFRTNASYQRWLDGRQRWATIVSQSRNMIRMAATFCDVTNEETRQSLDDLSNAVWLTSRTTMNKLLGQREDGQAFDEQLRQTYDNHFVDDLLSSPDPQAVALMEASLALDAIPVDEKRRVEIDKSLVIIGDTMEACDRIFSSPVPLVYTRHLARFLSLWMLLFPFAIHDEFVKADQTGLPTLPATALVALFLFGIEELAVQLEEPFSILPMQNFCDEIKDTAQGIIDWSAKSRGSQRHAQTAIDEGVLQ